MCLAKISKSLSFLFPTGNETKFTIRGLLKHDTRGVARCVAVAGLFGMASAQGFAAVSYNVTDLGIIPFGPNPLLNVHCFTDDGFLVAGSGDSKLYDLNSATPLAGYQLSAPEGYNFTRMEIVGVNTLGQIVGTAWVDNGRPRYAIVWDSPTSSGRIPQSSYYNCYSVAINESGNAVIVYNNDASCWNVTTGEITPLPNLPGDYGSLLPTGINSHNQIVGYAWTDKSGAYKYEAFIWDAENGTRGIGTLGGEESWGLGINGKGQVIGRSYADDSGWLHGFVWEEGTGMIDMGTFIPSDINENGLIIGNNFYGMNRAAIWDAENGMRQLSDLADLGEFTTTDTVAVNNNGEILVQILKNGEYHLLRLTAIPEPSTYAAMGGAVLGLAVLVSRRKKRKI